MKKLLFAILLPLPGLAQFTMGASSGFHYQNFNSLSNSTVATDFIDNVTIPGWYSQRTTSSIAYGAGAGTSNSGGLYSYGSTGSTDRALGTIGSSNTSFGGNFAHGVQFVNNTGANVTQMSVSYKMEQWRCGGNTTPNTLTFWYKILSTQMTNLMPGVFTGWTQVTALSASSPVNSATAGALNGNAAANKVVLNNISIPGLVIPNGSYIMLKWDDPDHLGTDHGLSIDDVTITWGCASSSILSVSSCGDYTSPAGISYPNSGTYAESITNSAFCDSIITFDLTVTPSTTYYTDADNDGFGDDATATELCVDPGTGFSLTGGDCDDQDETINPNASDICDGLDNDCDGIFEEDAVFTTYFTDQDNDGFGDDATATELCVDPGTGFSLTGGDCDDQDETINPNASDVCDGLDNDCDGIFEEDAVFTPYFTDQDNDGFGSGSSIELCSNPGPGFSTNDQDCDDTDATIYPSADELCDGLDNDCDGLFDEDFFFATYYLDEDLDGFGAGQEILFCEIPGPGYSLNQDDCDDSNDAINPDATEILNNGIDENCDGTDNYVGITDVESAEVEIFPNPTDGILMIKSNNNSKINMELTDLSGKIILQKIISNPSETIDLTSLSSGTYVLNVLIDGTRSQLRVTLF
jgi:hypothetical protein